MEKRVIAAVVLSMAIIIAFQYFSPKPVKPPDIPADSVQGRVEPQKEEPPILAAATRSPEEEKEEAVETGRYSIVFSNIGGSIKKISLKDYTEASSGEPLEIVSMSNPKEYILSLSSLSSNQPIDTSVYQMEKKGDDIIYSLKTDDYEIIKKYNLHNTKYGIELQLLIRNISNRPKDFRYMVIGGAGLKENKEQDKQYIEVTSKIDDKLIGYKRVKNGRVINPGAVAWTAQKNKYFSLILKPSFVTSGQFYKAAGNNGLVMGVESATMNIVPGASLENNFILYAGPGNITILKQFGYGLEETVNYGFFGGISVALIFVMRMAHHMVHNWGVAIILLSVLLNIVLFPLTIKSFKSMQKMQELHPQMEKLKVQHKGNPQKLNKEIMELYKKYRINPLSGCLPMLLQMPIFIALYAALIRSIELRGATFLWIKDLSMPDAVKIPITLPVFGDSINILPLLMIVAMVTQQKISTKTMGSAITDEQKQQQKMMLVVMPIVFGFIFYSMPSGLVLYWIVNTVLTIVEQSVILKKT